MSSSIFFNEPTVIDHSYIAGDGGIYGGSVNPSFIVTGAVDEHENVVLDFSSGKKRIKDWIDDNDNGFDHKCWIVRGVTPINAVYDVSAKAQIADWAFLCSDKGPDTVITVSTPHISITAPKSAFRFVANEQNYQDVYSAVSHEMKLWLTEKMPEFAFDVRMHAHAIPCVSPGVIPQYQLFRYVHGLKKSSSWGCQNIAHGHLSFIDVDVPSITDWILKEQILRSITKALDNTIFINAENCSASEYHYVIHYDSQSRGEFTMSIPKNSGKHKIVVLETETTIEHIIEYVAAAYKTQLKSLNATKLYVSEGLSKGAVLELNYED